LTLLLERVSARQPSTACGWPLAQLSGSSVAGIVLEHQESFLFLSCIPEVHKLKPVVTGYPEVLHLYKFLYMRKKDDERFAI
jgi:hypothetical protein